MARRKYGREFIHKVADELRALPPKKKATQQEVIRTLVGEMESLLQRGYSMEQIADAISGDGFDIAGPVLKSYLNGIRTESGGRTAGRRRGKKNTVPAPSKCDAPQR